MRQIGFNIPTELFEKIEDIRKVTGLNRTEQLVALLEMAINH